MKIAFELTGETPLLMRRDDVEAADLLTEWRKDPSNKGVSVPGDDRSPAWTWQTALYNDGENITMPAENVMATLRRAGAQLILKRQKTFKEISQSGLFIGEEHLEFRAAGKIVAMAEILDLRDEKFAVQAQKVKAFGIELFTKRIPVGTTKHVRVRPKFRVWSIHGEIEVLAHAKQELTFDVVERLFMLAGRVGIGDWRPSSPKCPGQYGVFSSKCKKA